MNRFQFASGDHEEVRCFVTPPARLCNKRGIVPEIRKKNGKTSLVSIYIKLYYTFRRRVMLTE